MPENLKQLVLEWTAAAGFDLAGIVSVSPSGIPDLQHFQSWISAGYAGEMEYLKRKNEAGRLLRSDVRNAIPWARSVIVCALNYHTAQPRSIDPAPPGSGWISRYAWSGDSEGRGTDYHDELLRRLRVVESRLRAESGEGPGLETRCYVDTGPIHERTYAHQAGLGWVGKNTCLIHQKLGSWIFLGTIVTSLELSEEERIPVPAPDRCGSCTRCIDACPTDAIVAPRRLDATRCISYLTIEKRGPIEPELRPAMGRHVFGCDICQDVCPWNRRAPVTSASGMQARQELVNPSLRWLTDLTEEQFRDTFRRTPIKRARYSGLRRNIAFAMGNSGDRGYASTLKDWAASEETSLADAATWALDRIAKFTNPTDANGSDEHKEPPETARLP